MFEVLSYLRLYMSAATSWRSALFLAILMAIIGPLQMTGNISANSAEFTTLAEENTVKFSTIGNDEFIQLIGDGTVNNDFTVEVPSTSPISDMQLSIEPSVMQTHYGFVWDSDLIWSNADATKNGTVVEVNSLTGSTAGTIWDFNTGLQGWTVSNPTFVGRYTNTCGVNGTSGGSIKTQANYNAPHHATSPRVNLAGAQNMPLHAWVLQGSFSCGEEPDSSEDLQIQYITSSGNWVTLNTWAGATQGGTAQQWSTNLPAAALHSSTQIRINQVSGSGASGTCCDFWFVDDVHLASPPESHWISPTIGWGQGALQPVSRSTYAPIYLDAMIPQGAFLNWSILDANGVEIMGASGSNDAMIPLNMIDYEAYPLIRLKLEFRGSPIGTGIPILHSIAGDGQFHTIFRGSILNQDWEAACMQGGAVSFTTGAIATTDCNLTSPWYTPLSPSKGITGDIDLTNGILQIRYSELANWTNLTSPTFTDQNEDTIYRYQLRIIHDNSSTTTWKSSSLSWTLLSGKHPAEPAIDFNQDGFVEWGGSDNRVGSWGWQDRFENGEEIISVTPGISGSDSVSAWLPRDNIQSFSVGVMAETGVLTGIYLRVANQLIANWSYDSVKSAYITLNSSQLYALSYAASTASSVGFLGSNFVQMDFEVTGTGGMKMAGLSVPYPVSVYLDSDQQSPMVLGINDARSTLSDVNGQHIIPIPFVSDTAGGMMVTLDGVNYSSDVEVLNSYMEDPVQVITTSQKWHTMHTNFKVSASNPGLVRLDVVGDNNHATWLIPSGGGSPIGQGDSELVELHPTDWLNFTQNGDDVSVAVKYRIEPGWDDEEYLTASTRLVLSNGVVSIPATHSWGSINGGSKALENDLEIKSVTFSTELGELPSDEYYLPAGQDVDISVDIGFEGLSGSDSFADGDALLSLYQGSNEIANTTTLDVDMWNYTDTVPFTNGVLDWRVEVVSLAGGGVTDDAVQERTFFADSVVPSVYWSSVAAYDHRVPSSTQTIQVQITDQPLLPSNIEAMVWREWVNDYDFNGQPSPDEYESFSNVLLPNDMTAFVGQYTILLDDSGGVIGDKVAVYLTGNDAAGHPLEDNGTGEQGDHLFMYQLKADGPPSIPTAAFTWEGGRQTWLHPMITYEFDVMMNEPNGGSDLSVVEVQLASQQNSDQLPISWDFMTGNCTTTSPHLVVEDCEMVGQDGIAGPYEEDITLNVEFHLLWTIPDLGDTKREPKLIVMDRAGNTDQQSFPTLRWRSSGDMYIPDETIQLIINQGTVVEDGARIAPSSSFEVSGDVLFQETNTRPDFDCPVSVMFDGVTYPTTAIDGSWTAVVTASENSGKKALTWGIDCISGQGNDVTDESDNRWILIDGTGPTPVEIINPRPNTILETEVYEVRVAINEEGGLDVESLQLEWWVEDADTGDRLVSGFETMMLEGDDVAGTQLEVYADVDLSEITDTMIEKRLILFVKINGRDLADNAITGMNGAPSGSQIAQWDLEWLRPEFTIGPLDVTYTRLILEVGQSTSVQALVSNIGSLDGTVDATAYVVRLNGTKEVLQRPNMDIPAEGKGLISIDWVPTTEGIQWIEVELDNGQTAKGPTVDVRPAREQGFVENLFGDVNPIIGSVVALIFVSIIVTILVWARKATRGRGSRSEYDWDEYSSEIDYDDYDDYEDESVTEYAEQRSIEPAASVGAASAALTGGSEATTEEENDWVMGADGYWWYHDKDTNEWWYKDENDDIVKFS